MSEQTITERTAYIGHAAGIRIHTATCATVQHYLGGGDKRGSSPALRSIPWAEAMKMIGEYASRECGTCRRMRTKAENEHRTADGTLATPVEGEPLMWLVRTGRSTWWVVELHSDNVRIEDIDLRDHSKDAPFFIPATVTRFYANEGGMQAGWYTDVEQNHGTEPYRRMQDAIDGMLLEIAQNRAGREARFAAKEA